MSVLDAYDLNLPAERIKFVPARLSRRAISFLIDLFVVELLFLFPLQRFFPDSLSSSVAILSYIQNLPSGLIMFIGALSSLIFVLYFSLCEYYLGRTLGMYILGLRVSSLTFSQSFIRHLFMVFLFPFSLLWIIDLIHLFIYKQRFLERLTDTNTFERISY